MSIYGNFCVCFYVCFSPKSLPTWTKSCWPNNLNKRREKTLKFPATKMTRTKGTKKQAMHPICNRIIVLNKFFFLLLFNTQGTKANFIYSLQICSTSASTWLKWSRSIHPSISRTIDPDACLERIAKSFKPNSCMLGKCQCGTVALSWIFIQECIWIAMYRLFCSWSHKHHSSTFNNVPTDRQAATGTKARVNLHARKDIFCVPAIWPERHTHSHAIESSKSLKRKTLKHEYN